jgi:hypothetical protein
MWARRAWNNLAQQSLLRSHSSEAAIMAEAITMEDRYGTYCHALYELRAAV